jgi:hypothetical protein
MKDKVKCSSVLEMGVFVLGGEAGILKAMGS